MTLHLTPDNCWLESCRPSKDRSRGPALFLDRDGTILRHVRYLSRVEDVAVIEGAVELILAANRAGWPVIVTTNQSGVGRGYFTWADFAGVQAAMIAALTARGAAIDMVLACPFHPQAQGAYRHPAHPWRKPLPGMILEGARHCNVALEESWIVGDGLIDMQAGLAAGLRGGFHVLTGHGQEHRANTLALDSTRFRVIPVEDAGGVTSQIETLAMGRR